MTLRQTKILLLFAGISLAACGGNESSSSPNESSASTGVAVVVGPGSAEVAPQGTANFLASVTGTVNTSVTWTVTEVGGGTVDSAGNYVAPSGTGTFHVVAKSVADPAVAGTAVVIVTASPSVTVAVSPSSTSVAPSQTLTFAAIVNGSSDTAVTWMVQEASACGAISSTGVYTAPTSAATCHVVATSHADGTKSATASVTVTATAPPPPASQATCANEPLRATGTTYYVCDCQAGAAPGCVAGNDANAGTSKSAPWQSWAKAMAKFKTMNGGDTIAMCKGGAWNGVAGTNPTMAGNGYSSNVTILNANCSASSTCDWRDYDPSPAFSATAKPLVRPADNVDVFAFGRSRFTSTGYTAPPIKGFRIFNLDLAANGSGLSSAVFVYGKTEDLEVCNLTIRDGFADSYAAQTTSTIKRVNFHHNRLTNNPFGVGQIRSPSCLEDCVFDSNYLDLNGAGSNRDHSIYIGSQPDPAGQYPGQLCGTLGCYVRAQRTRVTNNEIYRSAHGTGSTCAGTAIVVHEPHDDLVIENNLIHEDPGTASGGCFGLQLSSGGDAPGAFRRAQIRRNQIFNVGNSGIHVSECSDCVIENNLIVNAVDQAILFPGELYTTGSGSEPSARTTIRNNTIYNGQVLVNAGLVEGAGHIVANNTACGSSTSGSAAVRIGSGAAGYNNRSDASCSGLYTNPSADPMTANFSPATGSPLVGAGSSNYAAPAAIGTIPWSIADESMPRDALPDIGAYEK